MSSRRHNRTLSDSVSTSYGGMEEEEEETEVEDEREGGLQSLDNSLLFSSSHSMTGGERRQRGNTALTPLSPGAGLLGDV